MTDECTCPTKDGQRLVCSDGQVMRASGCPVHDPKPKPETCPTCGSETTQEARSA